MPTDTQIFGGHLEFKHCDVEACQSCGTDSYVVEYMLNALIQLSAAGTNLWKGVLQDQFVHKEMAPFYAALQMAERFLDWYLDEETTATS